MAGARRGRRGGEEVQTTADGKTAVEHEKADGSRTSTAAYKRYGAHVVERAVVDRAGQVRAVATASRDGLMEKTVVTVRKARKGLRELDARAAGSETPDVRLGAEEAPEVRHVTRTVTDTTLASPRTRTLDNVMAYRQRRAIDAPSDQGLAPLEKGTFVPQAGSGFHLAASYNSVDNGIKVDDRDSAWKTRVGWETAGGPLATVQQAGCSRSNGRVMGCHLSSEQRQVSVAAAAERFARDDWERGRLETMFRRPEERVDFVSATLWYYNPSEEAVHVTLRSLRGGAFPGGPGRLATVTSGTPSGRPRRLWANAMVMETAEGLRTRTEVVDAASPARIQSESLMSGETVRASLHVIDPHFATAVAEETRSRQPIGPHQVSDPRDPHNLQGDLRLIQQFLADLKGKPLLRESLRVTNRTGRGANHTLVTRFWSEGWAERLTMVSHTVKGERFDVTVLEKPGQAVALQASASDGTRLTVDAQNVFSIEREGEKASLPSLVKPSAGLRETVAGGGLSTLCRTLRRLAQATVDLPPFARQVVTAFSILPNVAGVVADDGPSGSRPVLGVGYLPTPAARPCGRAG
jgi:hypothetical protein